MFSGYEPGGWGLGTDAVRDGTGARPCLWAPGRTVGLILLKNGSPGRMLSKRVMSFSYVCLPWLPHKEWTVRRRPWKQRDQ